ncbi:MULTISPECIES: hypothetical protein [unclassified Tolypothrix]|uniref:hypothetical protein n=1 Tax=unclassified Tolypothrix TaxID=2649714 RepID=UPI0005EAB26A|nr:MULTISPECIES: hypothetical protein [unclassified Tolypothrix]BAY91196.1 hypothetical protein NIES3275_32180 [Microchaete diplosiphon NIES-3275]EKF00026.1 hypothetical protein FDUTEX481_09394 [Tolypothrix sp. PCC 7601]MBE9080841.1 hypothetical protein [Tolypothrix sp. LEGE 11397]UYD25279.1 hypothetical protein HGR01_28480 [Tolypothrix sp. PCC 7712]UYD32481.1 hypothetical protein HG267_26120 [Tolypothrix sp. PCC 7601]
MSENKINSAEYLEDGELSEEELDAQAGGTLEASGDSLLLDQSQSNILKQNDNMFTSFDGAKGTSLSNEKFNNKPMNMSLQFP